MISWFSANAARVPKRERALIAFAGISPDLDGFGMLVDPAARFLGYSTNYWGEVHHMLHNLGFCLLATVVAFLFAKVNRVKTAAMAFAVLHIHLLCDLIGSRGPEGYQWPIPYLMPFSDALQLTWRYQWRLNAWPNILIGFILVGCMFISARKLKRSPFELFSDKMDRVFTQMVKGD